MSLTNRAAGSFLDMEVDPFAVMGVVHWISKRPGKRTFAAAQGSDLYGVPRASTTLAREMPPYLECIINELPLSYLHIGIARPHRRRQCGILTCLFRRWIARLVTSSSFAWAAMAPSPWPSNCMRMMMRIQYLIRICKGESVRLLGSDIYVMSCQATINTQHKLSPYVNMTRTFRVNKLPKHGSVTRKIEAVPICMCK
jgi:hypothetical protein